VKVLHVIDALGVGGGAEHALAAMLPALKGRGIDSSVVCMAPRQGGLQAELQRQGFSVDVLSSKSWPGRVMALRRIVARQSPDIVHATLFMSCVVSRFACAGLGVSRVDSLVNTSYDPIRVRQLRLPAWKVNTVRLVDGVTARHLGGHFHCITDSVEREAVEVLGVNSDRITVIPRGRSAATLGDRTIARRREVRSRLDLNDAPVVLNVGRQDGQKAQATLVRAFAKLLQHEPRATLLIAGREGDASGDVRRAIAETGVSAETIRLLGHRTDVYDLYVAADIFVLPSLYEGLGSCLVEAMALDLPIIGSDSPAIAEVLDFGECGIIVARGDETALAHAMLELLADLGRQSELARRGHERFLRYYELEHVVDATVEMYNAIGSGRFGAAEGAS
jgi:glycosyltransferase involved in cell wall biosynthesis